ncbi:MG2 domain-containing protein [uncultured Winogradskyella sp.]|mgnify:CR=1 FL=1|uniref:MG2 domain-containing protein n=1 Tax=uncultured Winogradskyella sp. TaxID=395353 RepID=UPI0030DC0408|tara:strand:- start:66914 stop:69682 length:2769 start_codon:yes stop_codon:yes gene_type:complete
MRLHIPIIIVVFVTLINFQATNAQIANSITRPSLTKKSLAEKIYLQIDNTLYQTGETVWFKAIVSKSFDNSLSDISGILYVELIDENEEVIEKRSLKLNEGIADGSFNLQESYKTGKYVIRAYTYWNRNFDDDFIYSQPIEVFNLKEKAVLRKPIVNTLVTLTDSSNILTADINPKVVDAKYKGKLKLYIKTDVALDSVELTKDNSNIYKLNYQLPERISQAKLSFNMTSEDRFFNTTTEDTYSKTVIIDKDFLDVQFFPEGGDLVNGLLSSVGLKSLDYKGLGYKVSGSIKNNEGTVMTTFSSNDLGMCTFKLLPEQGKNYYAEIYEQDVAYTYPLPKAKPSGSVLSVASLNHQIRLALMHSATNLGSVRVKTSSRGVVYHDFNMQLKDQKAIASIPKSTLPDGIVKLSVYNLNNRIIGERLYFNHRVDKRLNLSLNGTRENYFQRDKTSVTLKLDSLRLSNTTSISVLVLQKDKLEASQQFKPNLLAQMLLNSELKGFIENPSSYFDAKNADSTLDLDALMLTQGWRAYKYSKSAPSTFYKYKAEKGLTVTGTIGEYFNPLKRPKKPLDLNMIVYDEPAAIYKQEIDSSGRYRFEIDAIYKPKIEVFMQVVDKKGVPVNFGINRGKKWKPEVKLTKAQDIIVPEQVVTQFTQATEITNKRKQDYQTFYNTIALDEVELRDYELTPAREKSIELHGEPQHVIDGKELVKVAPEWNYGVYSVLKAKYPDLVQITVIPGIPPWLYAKVVKSDLTLVLVDNIPVYYENYRFIQDIPVEEVVSMDIIEDAKEVYRYAFEIFGTGNINFGATVVSYLNIYTKSGNGLLGITKAKGVLTDQITGFTESVAFYAPTYETLSNQDWNIPDNRSVIHWSPNVVLNAKGEYTLEFYNDDYVGDVAVIVEAISKDGKLGTLQKTYTVKEAER